MDIKTAVSNRTMIPNAKFTLTRSNDIFFNLDDWLSFDCDDNLVTDPANIGTYNFFGPRYLGGIPHALTDVIPYYAFGTTPEDMFNPQRFEVTYDLIKQKLNSK